ncbi:MAG: branched-chain amino acid transport system II carrier protein [Veillonellaceae bacterium]|nr:branched-chain amino acid transport system II carrier protein [Veillonellaceae bacterium]
MSKTSNHAYVAIGLMLFALFFGAGNLIFPASLGQHAGTQVWWAILGFVITGVGLPILGVMALGVSGCRDAQELASRVHPAYGLIYTVLLYLSIGPAFALPRTGTVSYEIAIKPFLGDPTQTTLTIFLLIFFAITLWLSINPQKLLDRIGKLLTPLLLLAIVALIVKSFITPLGTYMPPVAPFGTTDSDAITMGFLDGYNTMDALASIVFGVIIVQFSVLTGANTKKAILSSMGKASIITMICLGLVYIFIANLGATSVQSIGILDTGAPVLAESAKILFGNAGAIILAVIVLLACLTTSVGLVTSCATYFQKTFGGLSYKKYAILFTVISFFVGLWGLKTIIVAAIPILMFLYPLTIVLIILAFVGPIFQNRQCVYAWTMGLTVIPALVSGLETAKISLGTISSFFANYVPLHTVSMDWIVFGLIGYIIGIFYKAATPKKNTFGKIEA